MRILNGCKLISIHVKKTISGQLIHHDTPWNQHTSDSDICKKEKNIDY